LSHGLSGILDGSPETDIVGIKCKDAGRVDDSPKLEDETYLSV
jgi:hypothetical protein